MFPSQLSCLPTPYSELSPALSRFMVFLSLLRRDKSGKRCAAFDAFDSTLFLSLSFISISSPPPLTLLIVRVGLIDLSTAVLYLHRVKPIQSAHTSVTSLKASRPGTCPRTNSPAEASTTLLSSVRQTGNAGLQIPPPSGALIARR